MDYFYKKKSNVGEILYEIIIYFKKITNSYNNHICTKSSML